MVDSDSFIISSLCNWDFGADNTGNIMSSHNIRAFRARVLQGGLADIVTGDGGIGCDENPEEQERLTARLVMCEVIAGIGVLKPGGCMIIKMFTTFTAGSTVLVATAYTGTNSASLYGAATVRRQLIVEDLGPA